VTSLPLARIALGELKERSKNQLSKSQPIMDNSGRENLGAYSPKHQEFENQRNEGGVYEKPLVKKAPQEAREIKPIRMGVKKIIEKGFFQEHMGIANDVLHISKNGVEFPARSGESFFWDQKDGGVVN